MRWDLTAPTLLGEIVADECEAREWSKDDFARITGVPTVTWERVFAGTEPVSDVLCLTLSLAFGTSKELWERLRTASIGELR